MLAETGGVLVAMRGGNRAAAVSLLGRAFIVKCALLLVRLMEALGKLLPKMGSPLQIHLEVELLSGGQRGFGFALGFVDPRQLG